LKADAKSDEEREIGDKPDKLARIVSESCRTAFTCNGCGDWRESSPRAGCGKSDVRFDEGVWKRKHGRASEAPTDERSQPIGST